MNDDVKVMLSPLQMELLERVRARVESEHPLTVAQTVGEALCLAHEQLYGTDEHNKFLEQGPARHPEEAKRMLETGVQKALLDELPTDGEAN